MKKYLLLLITLLLLSCESNRTQNDFINYDCNIPIIECVINKDTVNLIVDTGAEYSLIDSDYYQNNKDNFRRVNEIGTQFFGIGGVVTEEVTSVLIADTPMGYITFIEHDLSAVIKAMSEYNVVGLIGSDFLKSHNYIVDYKMRKIYPFEHLDSIHGKSNN